MVEESAGKRRWARQRRRRPRPLWQIFPSSKIWQEQAASKKSSLNLQQQRIVEQKINSDKAEGEFYNQTRADNHKGSSKQVNPYNHNS